MLMFLGEVYKEKDLGESFFYAWLVHRLFNNTVQTVMLCYVIWNENMTIYSELEKIGKEVNETYFKGLS